MMARVRGELKGAVIDGLQACTFHAWCYGLLQRRGAGFGVLDDKDLWVYLRRRIRDLRLKHFVRVANVGQFLDSLLDFMRRCQDELVGPAQYALYVERLERGEVALPRVARSKKQTELKEVEILERCQEIARVFATVENMLREENLGTFGHMITKAYQLLKNDPALLEEERRRTRFLLVDECQGREFCPGRDLVAARRTGGERFCRGRCGSGDLPVSRRFERSIHAVYEELSRGPNRGAGKEPALALAHSRVRFWHCEREPASIRRSFRTDVLAKRNFDFLPACTP